MSLSPQHAIPILTSLSRSVIAEPLFGLRELQTNLDVASIAATRTVLLAGLEPQCRDPRGEPTATRPYVRRRTERVVIREHAAKPVERRAPVLGRARFGYLVESIMSLLSWIVLGLIAGFIASKIVNRTGEGVIVDILLGIVGAIVGGWLFRLFGMPGVSGLNIYSSVVAIIGAAVVLLIYHTTFRRFRDGRA